MNPQTGTNTSPTEAIGLAMPPFELPQQTLEDLAKSCDLTERADFLNLKRALEEVGRRYLNARENDAGVGSIKTQNSQLKRFENMAGKMFQLICELEDIAPGRLASQLNRQFSQDPHKVDCNSDPVAFSLEFLHKVKRAAAKTANDGRTRPGPQPDRTLDLYVAFTIEIYETFSGRAYTHNDKINGEYKSKTLSDGGKFLTIFFSILDPAIGEGRLVKYSAGFISSRNNKIQKDREGNFTE